MQELVAHSPPLAPSQDGPGELEPRSRRTWTALMLGAGLMLLVVQVLAAVILSPYLATWAVGALMCICGATLVLQDRLSRTLQAECTRASTLIQLGELSSAREHLDQALLGARRVPTVHALLLFNRGVVELESGDLESARRLCTRATASGWITPRGPLAGAYPQVCLWMTLLEALSGNVDEARRWRDHVSKDMLRRARDGAGQGGVLAQQLAVDVILHLRAGEHAEALQQLDNERPGATPHLSERELRLLDVLKTFAREQSGGDQYRLRADDLAGADDPAAPRDEFNFLGASWPEMADFLRRRR